MCNFCEVCDLLFEAHGAGRADPLTTLNELFDKHLRKWQLDSPKPVVIVHYRGRDCLIDGRRRVNVWKRTGETGMYPAYLLTVGISL